MSELNNINTIIGFPMSSICCKAQTHIGYFNITKRPDLYGVKKTHDVLAVMGTYCDNCGELCDFTDDNGNKYYTNGIKKEINEKIY